MYLQPNLDGMEDSYIDLLEPSPPAVYRWIGPCVQARKVSDRRGDQEIGASRNTEANTHVYQTDLTNTDRQTDLRILAWPESESVKGVEAHREKLRFKCCCKR